MSSVVEKKAQVKEYSGTCAFPLPCVYYVYEGEVTVKSYVMFVYNG